MTEISELASFVQQLLQENTKIREEAAKAREEAAKKEDNIQQILQALQADRPLNVQVQQPQAPEAAVVRAGQILDLRNSIRSKHAKVKDFVEGQDTSARVWLRRLDYEVGVLKGLKGINNDLTEAE